MLEDPNFHNDPNVDPKSPIFIRDLAAWMDGGSVTLACINTLNQRFTIDFGHPSLPCTDVGWLPGRLYFNGNLVEERSELENIILSNLEKAEIQILHNRKDSQQLQYLILKEVIEYIRSEEFIEKNRKTALIMAAKKK